ncbi:MAG: lytic transglycosylase domain-containing protein [Acidobacteria bacterium]|nr:lytic transglycosylase domain-containing protein [Acidobacteriota bacterium]
MRNLMHIVSTSIAARRRRRAVDSLRTICRCQTHRRRSRLGRITAGITSVLVVILSITTPLGAEVFHPILTSASELLPFSASVEIVEIESEVRRPVAPRVHRWLHDRLTAETVRRAYFRDHVPYGSIIYEEAQRNGLRPELVAAVVKTESDFRPRLVSHKNALGLMQIIPSTGRWMGAGNLFNPDENIKTGARYLRYLHRRFEGDETLLLAAYNAGEGNVRRYGGVPPFDETRNYVGKVAISNAEYEARIRQSVAEWNRLALRLRD